jgi:hypothetical protein
MNIAHDHKTCQTGDSPGRTEGRAGDEFAELRLPIDWQALRARLFAATELRAELGTEGLPEGLRLRLRGSFDGCAASVLTTYQETSRAVNLEASAYGKPGGGNPVAVAGMTSTGGRGHK